jgi:hypothetical protein
MAAKIKRGYSREYTPHGDTGKNYLLAAVPAGLWANVRAHARRDGISVRALILRLLTEYVGERTTARSVEADERAAGVQS